MDEVFFYRWPACVFCYVRMLLKAGARYHVIRMQIRFHATEQSARLLQSGVILDVVVRQ